jgi:hypothetical protein
MKELIADENGTVEGLSAQYPPGTIVYIDEAGHYGGHSSPTVEEEPPAPVKRGSKSKEAETPQLQEPSA